MSCSSNAFATSNPAQGNHFYNTMSSWYTDVLGSRITHSGGRMIIGDIMTYFAEATNSNLNGIWGQLQSTTAFDIWHAESNIAQPEDITQPVSITNLIGYVGSALSRNTYMAYNRINDIYLWLEDYENYQVWNILDDIAVSNSNISSRVNTTNSRLNTVNTNLNNILTALNNLVDYTQILNSIDSHVDQLEGYVDGLESTTSTISSRVNTTNSKLDTLIGHVDGLEGYTDGIEGLLTTGNTNTANIYSATDEVEGLLSSFRDDFNRIQWVSGNRFLGVSLNRDTNYLSEVTYSDKFYAGFNIPSVHGIFKFVIPLQLNNGNVVSREVDLKITMSSGSQTFGQVLAYDYDPSGLVVYAIVPQSNAARFYVNVENNVTDGLVFVPTMNGSIYYIADDNKDFYEVANFVFGFRNNRIYEDFKFLYADDNSLAAKKANQNQENSVLTNFTGSGSASASVSDYNDIASASSAVKNGLSSNASPSNVLGVFNGNDGFGWFSQSTLDSLDSVGVGSRSFKSTNSPNDTPLLDQNMDAILRYLVGGEDK